jgi:hypothetical protein
MRTLIVVGLAAGLAWTAREPPEPSIAEVCVADHARLCDEPSIHSDGAMRCLMSRRQDAASCRAALDARRQWVLDRVRKACTNEIAAFCAREAVDAPVRCLRHHNDQLSDACKAALPRWMS